MKRQARAGVIVRAQTRHRDVTYRDAGRPGGRVWPGRRAALRAVARALP